MTDPTRLTLKTLNDAYRRGALDPAQATAAYLDAILEKNPRLNAYLVVTDAQAREAAETSKRRWAAGAPLGPLDGAPIAIKDNIDLAGFSTTNGCAFGSLADADAEVVARMKAAGAVILGKLNLHEAALGGTTDNPHWGRTQNPRRQGYTPGGSSGGSGAAVAAGLAGAALGTDTLGSVRIPAAFCGVWGFKPTFGLVSTDGVAPLAATLDHVGPIARSAGDLRLMLNALAGGGGESAGFSLKGLRVGRVREIEAARMDMVVRTAYAAFLVLIEKRGATLVETAWQGFDPAQARRAGFLLAEADAAAAMNADLERRPDRFSPDLRRMLHYGAAVDASRRARIRTEIDTVRRLVLASVASVDVLALPTTPMTPFPFDGAAPENLADFCAPANFAGCPALALPAGETRDGLPIGVQLLAAPGRDLALIDLAVALTGD